MARLWLRSSKSFLVCVSCALSGVAIASNRTLSNDCAGLLPDVIGEPRARSFPMPRYAAGCLAMSTRSGILSFGVVDGFAPTEYWFYDGDDTQVGHFYGGCLYEGPYSSTDTFQELGFSYIIPDPTVTSWTDRGDLISQYQLDPER